MKAKIDIFLKTIRQLWSLSSLPLSLMIIVYILESFVPIASIYLFKVSTDTIIEIIRTGEHVKLGFILITLQTLLAVLSFSLDAWRRLLHFRLEYLMRFEFKRKVLMKTSKLPLIYFDIPETYNQIERASNTSDRGITLVVTVLDIVKSAITFGGYLALLLSISRLLPIGMLILTVPSLLIHIWVGKINYRLMVSQTPVLRKVEYLFRIMHSRDAAKELKVFDGFPYLLQKWITLFKKNMNEQYEVEKKSSMANLFVSVIRDFSSLIFIAVLLWMSIRGAITFGEFVAFSSGISLSLSLINSMSEGAGKLHNETLFMSDFYRFLDEKEEDRNGKDHPQPERTNLTNDRAPLMEINHLSFSYPTADREVLKDISLHINKGEKLAIVGDNGAGKTTLIKCLMGLYSPGKGNVFYKGMDIRDLDPKMLRKKYSTIFQDFMRYQLTVRENIGISRPEAMHNDDAMIAAAQESGILNHILALNNGFETELGTEFLGGQELSGGQWQKIGLSRAIFRDAEIVILDEPTAALDPLAETELLKKFIEIFKDKTAIFITHRLGSCKYMDRIIVLKDGRKIEEGTHEQLLKQNKVYTEMYNAQAKWYS